jgi:hypothetical protein
VLCGLSLVSTGQSSKLCPGLLLALSYCCSGYQRSCTSNNFFHDLLTIYLAMPPHIRQPWVVALQASQLLPGLMLC